MLLRKLRTKYRHLYFLFFFVSSFVYSQQYFSKQLTTKDGLPDNNVYAVLKDRDGKLWIGTENGLVVKGAKLTTIYKKKDGLPNNACWQIIQDQLGQIWIGTFGGGLALYKNGKFQKFDSKDGLSSDKIRKLFLYKDDLYIGTSNGISKINIHSKKIENLTIKDKSTCIINEKKDVVVLGIVEVNGKIIFNTHSHGVYIINGKNADVLHKSLYTTFCLYKDKDYIIFSKNGFDTKGKALYKVNTKDFISNKRPAFKTIGYNNSIFWDLKKIKNGSILGAAHGVEYATGGLYLVNGNIKKLNAEYGIQSNNIWDLFYDKKEDVLYIGTLGEGLYITDFKRNIVKNNIESVIDYQSNSYFKSVLLQKDLLKIESNNKQQTFSKNELYQIIKNKINGLPKAYKDLNDGSNGDFPYNGFTLKSLKINDNVIYLSTNYGMIELKFSTERIDKKVYVISAQAYKFINKNSLFYAFPYASLIYIPNLNDPLIQKKYENLDKRDFPRDIVNIFFTRKNKYLISRAGDIYLAKGNNFSQLKFSLIQQSKDFEYNANISDSKIALGTKDCNIYILNDGGKNISFQKIINQWGIYGNTLLGLLKYNDYIIPITEKGINLYCLRTKKNIVLDKEMGIEYNNVYSASIYKNQLKLATDNGTYDIDLSL